MNYTKWNLMIMMVNHGVSREKAEEYFTKSEMKIFDNMKAELLEMKKKNPKAAFYPVESDW